MRENNKQFGKQGPQNLSPVKNSETRFSERLHSLILLGLPAVVAVLGLFYAADKLLEGEIERWTSLSFEPVLNAVRDSHPDAMDMASWSGLTVFDSVTPFAFRQSDNARQGLDDGDVRSLVEARNAGNAHFAPSGSTRDVFVWTDLNASGEIGGVKIAIPQGFNSLFIALLLLVFAVLLVFAIDTYHREKFDALENHLLQRIDALPDGKRPVLAANLNAPLFMREADAVLEDLKNRFQALREGKKAAIISGRKARKMKSRFFAGMSHDLRSPLNSVIGFTDLLLKEMEGPLTDQQRKGVQLIAEDAEKLIVLIADILDTSKLEAGRLELERAWVPAVEVLTECAAEAKRLIGTRPIELKSFLQPGLPPVYIDKTRLRQAVVSLVASTISTMKQGTIGLRGSSQKPAASEVEHLSIDIIDTHHAVSLHERERMRTVFHSSEGTQSQSQAGALGVGMALARDIARLHKGDLTIAKNDEDNVVFRLLLPFEDGLNGK